MQAMKKGNVAPQIPTTSWEFMALSRDILGQHAMFRIYGMERSTLGRMCLNPEIHEDARRNLLDRVALHLTKMVEAGEVEACRAQVSELCRIVGMEMTDPDASCQPEGKPIHEELMDIHPAVVEHAQAIRREDSEKAVDAWEREAIRQIKQATRAYKAGCVCRGNR